LPKVDLQPLPRQPPAQQDGHEGKEDEEVEQEPDFSEIFDGLDIKDHAMTNLFGVAVETNWKTDESADSDGITRYIPILQLIGGEYDGPTNWIFCCVNGASSLASIQSCA
jgi:hypothetical protein